MNSLNAGVKPLRPILDLSSTYPLINLKSTSYEIDILIVSSCR
jgi:hypothetical protein